MAKNQLFVGELSRSNIVVTWMGFKIQFSAFWPYIYIARSAPKKCHIWRIVKKNSTKTALWLK